MVNTTVPLFHTSGSRLLVNGTQILVNGTQILIGGAGNRGNGERRAASDHRTEILGSRCRDVDIASSFRDERGCAGGSVRLNVDKPTATPDLVDVVLETGTQLSVFWRIGSIRQSPARATCDVYNNSPPPVTVHHRRLSGA